MRVGSNELVATMAPNNKLRFHRPVFGALLLASACQATAGASTLPPPTEQELAGDSLFQFIVHHATTPYPTSTGVYGSLSRWRGGRPQTVCPLTTGLEPAYNAYVTARVRELATEVGAPVYKDSNCKDNVEIIFTSDPLKIMAKVQKSASLSLGVRYLPRTQKQLEFSGTHAIQGWYITSTGGDRILNTDADLLAGQLDLLALWPMVIQSGMSMNRGGFSGSFSGIIGVVLVIDTARVTNFAIGPLADYLAMLSLSLVQSPDHCDPLPSILDLMSPSCGTREKPTSVTAGDVAFLKALYYENTGLGPTLSRDDMQSNMLQQFKGH